MKWTGLPADPKQQQENNKKERRKKQKLVNEQDHQSEESRNANGSPALNDPRSSHGLIRHVARQGKPHLRETSMKHPLQRPQADRMT
jgi:hypothetical protein